jgi:Ni,Fe-hydrogenase III large subunit
LERLANHIGDLGALSGDVAFLPPAAYFGRIRGEFLNLLLLLSGNRFGKNLIRPGGVVSPVTSEKVSVIRNKCLELTPQIEHVSQLMLDAASVLSRFENTGTVTKEKAETLGLVGLAGRASGLDYDVRSAFPTEYYTSYAISPQVETTGDVLARAKVRVKEIKQSLTMIRSLPTAIKIEDFDGPRSLNLAPASFVVTLTEGWRGELSHCLLTNEQGKLVRYKIKDPSFHNWNGLAVAMRNQDISDFPVCNKSFNLSYCGFDL